MKARATTDRLRTCHNGTDENIAARPRALDGSIGAVVSFEFH